MKFNRNWFWLVLLTSLLVLFAGVQTGLGRIGPVPGANEEYIYAQESMAGVYNNPPSPTVFTIDQPRKITKLGSYHWNGGQGHIPGTLGLQDQSGRVYGPWQTTDPKGQSGVPSVYWWLTIPNGGVTLPAGTYTVLDSDPSTWSYNSETGNCGVVAIVALKVSSETLEAPVAPVAPCVNTGDGGPEDLSPGNPTNLYFAGPSLVPGSYKIWCGMRTGTNIGVPDKWNTYGPVTLVGGTFYIFDVTTGNIGPATSQLINPMLQNPTPSESVVWYKRSTQYPYVVCFEGPLSGTSSLETNTNYQSANVNGLRSSRNYSGVAVSDTKNGRSWPFKLTLIGPDANGKIGGQIEWPSLGSINQIEGSETSTGITFAETAYIKKGGAVLNCKYQLNSEGESFAGTWGNSCADGDHGTISMNPE